MAKKKLLRGLSSDTRPSDQPEGTYPFAKNGIKDFKKLADVNEPGFTISSANIPYKVNGAISTDTLPIIFSTDDVNSAVGFFDKDNDIYTPIINDASLGFKIGFKRANYITGTYQKSNKGDYIAVFTDKVLNPMWLNCTNPNVTKADDLLFFLRAKAPVMDISTISGGQLLIGSYIVYAKYARNDGSETPYITSSQPIVVSGGANVAATSGKAISIQLSGVDMSYDYVVISIIKKINGVTTAEQLDYIATSPTMNILYTGSNTTTTITVEEILVAPAIYNRVGCMTQLNDTLFFGNMDRAPDINYQKYASLIQVRYVSKLIDVTNIPEEVLDGLEKGFPHGETVALYIRLNLIDGSKTKAFTIAGRAALSGEEDVITDHDVTGHRYQIHDTAIFPSLIDNSGTPGLWLNQNETYPNTDDFNSTTLGGPDLRNQKVRHHRMPTHRYTRQTFYSGSGATSNTHGVTTIDILGIKLSGVVIPASIVDMVDSYEILFAERTTGNMTVLGQSEVLYGAQALSLIETNAQTNFVSSAGNWLTIADISGFRDINRASDNPLHLKFDRIRMHPFELLFNKLSIPEKDSFIQYEWAMTFPNVNNETISFGIDLNIPPNDRRPTDIKPVIYLLDYIGNSAVTSTTTSDSNFLRKLKKVQYAPNNVNGGEWNNSDIETSVVGQLTQAGPSISVSQQHVAIGQDRMKRLNTADFVQFENTFLGTLRCIKDDVYDSVFSQSLVNTGQKFGVTVSSTPAIFAGDVFPCDYTYHTFGWVSDFNGDAGGGGDQSRAGTKVIRRIVCESIANINQRYEIPGNIYSQWFPHTAVSYFNCYLFDFQRSFDPNQFGYSKDLNALNNLETISIFSPGQDSITKFPYRVHRGGAFKRQGKPGSWRTFLPLDYYDMPKNRGVIINLCGFDDNLLIHHESSLFVTQDKTTLKGDIISVTLGTADIFQYAPLEAMASSLGYAGTHHDLACVLTPLGYIFVDNKSGEVFLFKNNLKLLNANLNNFLRQYTRVSGVNCFIGNGITIGYDPEFKRILLTTKNTQLTVNQQYVVPGYEETTGFFSQLVEDQSIVYNKGTWMVFKGTNTTEFSCDPDPDPPVIADNTFSIPENSPSGTFVGQIVVSDPQESPLTFVILSGNTGGAFQVNSDAKVVVANPVLDFETLNTYTLTVRAINTFDLFNDADIVINITDVNEPPTVPDYTISINENIPNGTDILTIVGTDPEGHMLSYVILDGDPYNSFILDVDLGVLSILDNTELDYESHPIFILHVQVSDGTNNVISTVTINLIDVNEGPTGTGATATVFDTTTVGVIVISGTPAHDPEADQGRQTLTYTLHSETDPGVFTVGLDPSDPVNFLQVRVAMTLSDATYQVIVRATDSGTPALFVDLIYTINVIAVPSYSAVRTADFQKDDCADSYIGSVVTFSKTYHSSISVPDAESIAAADTGFDTEGQANANTLGSCTAEPPSDTTTILVVDFFVDTDLDLMGYCDTTGTIPYHELTYEGVANFFPNDGTDAASCWSLASDRLAGPPTRRFEFNLIRLMVTYPAISSFVFKIHGRRVGSSGTVSGAWVLKNGGHMVMSASPGTYIPSVVGDTTLGSTSFSGITVGGSGDGTYGLGVGAVIMTFTYDVATKIMTQT